MRIAQGTFRGEGGHVLSGSFTLTRLPGDGSIVMETSANFFFDGSPEPGWALIKGVPTDASDPRVKAAAEATRFGAMPGDVVPVRGIRRARLPDEVDIDAVDTLFLWCFRFPFLLGIGPIERI